MAECVENSENKCSSRLRRSQLRTWTLCFVIKVLILPCVLSKCLNVDISVASYPQGDIEVLYGQPLEILCVAESGYTSNDLKFMLSGEQLESKVINSSTISLFIDKPEKQVNTYYCKNTKTDKNCLNRVLIDSPPLNVTDFKCISYNLESLNCSWTKPEAPSNIQYNLTFAVNGNFVAPPCVANEIEQTKTRYCVWDSNSLPRYRQQADEIFLELTAWNVFGVNRQNFSIKHFAIVKADPPMNLLAVEKGPHSALLTWNIPNNIFDFLHCGIDHKIEYQIEKIDNKTFFHQVDATSVPGRKKTYKFQLTNLPYAHMRYEVRVYIKSKLAPDTPEFWSYNSFDKFITASERPPRPPDTTAGAFDKSDYSDRRVIYVYWKQLEEYEESGENFTYKVLVSQDNQTHTYFPDKNKSLSYVKLNSSLNAMDVIIWSFNQNGSSLNSSQLYIPSVKNVSNLGLTSFTKLAYDNGTYELAWGGDKNIDNYTLFWCQHNSTNVCIGQMNYTVLDPMKSRYVIDLPRDQRYQFAISANNGTTTSGIVWAKCDISKEGFVMYRFNMHLKYDVPGKTFVNLKWEMECVLQDGIITGYKITYCPIVLTSTDCDKSFGNKYVYISNPKQMNKLIEDLLPFRTYQFSIAINTIYGQKDVENATALLTTSEDTPTSPVNVVISNVTHNSLDLSWDPPIHRNGIIGKYVIYNYNKEFHVDKVSSTTDISRRTVHLEDLLGFSNYSLSIQACNIAIRLCSNTSTPVYVRTAFGAPSRLKAPAVKNNPDQLLWEQPEIAGGTVDLFQIKIIKDDNAAEIINTTYLSYNLTHCEGVVSTETYQVRAINFDEDLYHGVIGNTVSAKKSAKEREEYPGPWSEPSTVACRSRDSVAMIIIFLAIFASIALGYGFLKLYKKYRKMEDIKPVLPYGLGEPEKDRSKFPYPEWNPINKDEKPSSDEMLLLPNSKSNSISTDTKQKDDNCAASDHTDSTALSDSSAGPVDQQVSTSDDGSDSSLHLEAEADKGDASTIVQEDSSTEESVSSRESSPYISDNSFRKNPVSNYDQLVPAPDKNVVTNPQPTTSSYVMAGLATPVFTNRANPAPSSGYVLAEDVQSKSMLSFPKVAPLAPENLGPESLPTLPTLPPPVKPSADSSYIQLQPLDTMPSLKTSVRNTVPLKPPTSSGYVSPGDVVINKHLNNILSGGQLAEESAILDPTMSPDAYCRFSWSTDPANDNLHSLLADSPARNTPKN